MEKPIIQEIKRICGKMQSIQHVGCLFKLGDIDCMYMDYKDPHLLKFTIPCLACIDSGNRQQVTNIINQLNREVKYVKTFLLDNGCVSLVYERRIMEGEETGHVVPHVIKTLDFAAGYVKQRIFSKKKQVR